MENYKWYDYAIDVLAVILYGAGIISAFILGVSYGF